MLKPKALAEVLNQANTGGILSTLLITKEGTLLAYAGNSDIKASITAAMASNLFQCYEKNGQESFREEGLKFLIIDCENGVLAITKVANLYLCMHAKETTPTGMIKVKLETVAQYLETPLSQVMAC